MAYTYPKEALKVMLRDERYEGPLPAFHDPSLFPELKPLLDNWEKIREEVFHFEKANQEISGISSNEYVSAQYEGTRWSNMYLDNFMWRHHKNRVHFPFICSVVDQIPNASLAVLSVLYPHSAVKPHYGDTNGIVRCQLGLSVPDTLPACGLGVADEKAGWQEGKLTLFTEAYLHSAWNWTEGKRYVLIVDIVPSFISKSRMAVCASVLGAQTVNYLENRFAMIKRTPMPALRILHSMLSLAWRLYLPVQRSFKFLSPE